MNDLLKKLVGTLLAAVLAVGSVGLLTGCDRDGPIEDAAEDVEEGAEELGD